MSEGNSISWRRVNDEPFEYAIQQGPHGEEFVKLSGGVCLRRAVAAPLTAIEPVLGERMHVFGVVLHGSLAEVRWLEFLHEVTNRIGMNAIAQPAVWHYPTDGKGGNGQTIMLPITESFLVLDTWPDHRGSYLFVCSCKRFDGSDIDAVAYEFGLKPSREMDGRFGRELNLA